MMSDPAEYAIDSISREAGKIIFERSGIGDPYKTGIPYAFFLGLQRAYPRILGANPESLSGRFGFVSRTPAPSSPDADLREGLPIGMHLTTDPLTGVAFLVTSCAVCHADRLRWPGGEALVVGLGNKRVRIHDYDAAFARVTSAPRFTASHLGTLAARAAEERGLVWPEAYREILTAATIRALEQRATDRAELRARTRDNPPGRVATIESFVLALAQLTRTRIEFAPPPAGRRSPT